MPPLRAAAGLAGCVAVLVLAAGCGSPASTSAPPTSAVPTPAASAVPTPSPSPAATVPTASPVLADACVIGPGADATAVDPTVDVVQALESAGFRVRTGVAVTEGQVPETATGLLATRCALVMSVYEPYADQLVAVAQAHPDLPVAAAGITSSSTLPANVTRLGFDVGSAAFVAGYLAAGASSSGRLGALGLADDPEAERLARSFVAGARYRASQTGTDVSVLGSSRRAADDRAAERLLRRWARSGVDVAFTASPGLSRLAPVARQQQIGIGLEQERNPGALGWLVTDPAVSAVAVAQQVADGLYVGGDVDGTLADGGVRVEVGDVPPRLRTQVSAVVDDVASGRLATDPGD